MNKELTELHHKAMDYAENGFFLQQKKNHDEAKIAFDEAFKLEKQVADVLIALDKPIEEIEPSRSTIVLSAAALARDAGNQDQCNYYANKVIAFNYDNYFVEEAKSLL